MNAGSPSFVVIELRRDGRPQGGFLKLLARERWSI